MEAADWERLLLTENPDVLSAHSADGTFLWVAAGALSVLGWSAEALVGEPLLGRVHREDRGLVERGLQAAQRVGATESAPLALRYRIGAPGGEYHWVESTVRAPARPAAAALICATRRMVHQPLAAAAYSEPESEWLAAAHRDQLVAMLPGMVWYGPVSPDLGTYRVTYMSRYLEKVAGYTPEEWISTPGFWSSILHPEDKEHTLASVRGGLSGAALPPYRILGRDGRAIWVQSYLGKASDSDGTALRMYGLTLDVTPYKEAELRVAELHQRESALRDRLDTLLARLPGIVWERWEAGPGEPPHATFCSEYLTTLTGYTVAEWAALPRGWLDLIPASDHADLQESWAELLHRGGERTLHHRVLTRHGPPVWLANHLTARRDATGTGVLLRGVAIDITAEMQVKAERLQLQAENQRQAERISELSTPLIPVSSEIVVVPLTGVVDQARAGQILDSLLRGVEQTRARFVILDVTGVLTLDAISGRILLNATQALRLVGAQVILTGIRAEVAQTVVRLGADLSGLTVRTNLQSALAELLAVPRAAPRAKLLRPAPVR